MPMWAITQGGFVSAVAHRDEPGALMVRARDAQSLRSLADATGAPVVATPRADYPYRVTVTKAAFAAWITEAVDAVDYPNFKSRAVRTRGSRYARALSEVWSTMHDIEDEQARPAQEGGCR